MPYPTGSAAEPVLEAAKAADLPGIVQLLTANGLPAADVNRQVNGFVVARSRNGIIGTAGLEPYGEVALIRSLCVAKPYRGQHLGTALLSTIETAALTRGVRELYLLTIDAAPYFERHGYTVIPRDEMPEAIRRTTEFASLCPSSATAMRKRPPGTVH